MPHTNATSIPFNRTKAMSPPQRISLFSSQPGFRGNVRSGESDLLIDNSPYSRFYHITVNTADNEPLYDLAALAEPTGAVALAINKAKKIALLRHFRPVPATDPCDRSAYSRPTAGRHGFISLEFPRGFPQGGETCEAAAAREVEEEVGVQVLRSKRLGWCNFNTALVMTDIPVVACVVGDEVGTSREATEVIEEVEWVDVDELAARISRGEVRCGLTLSAAAYLFASRTAIEGFVRDDGV